jgi:hypothetical protein
MSDRFAIDVDPSRHLVRIRMSGFFTRADIDAFLEARRVAHRRLACPANAHVTLNDVREMKIQSNDIVERFRAMLADPAFRSRRLAFVVAPTLARMQVERAVGAREARFFEDAAEAEAWLMQPEAPRRAAA